MTKRFYTGSRDTSRLGAAAKIKKIELQKGGKLNISSEERYKMMMEEKLAEQRAQSRGKSASFTPPGAKTVKRTLSAKAEEALEEIAKRKAAKKEKEMRDRVVVHPKNLQYGRIDNKGRIFDLAGNQVLKIDTKKKGYITTMTGWRIGKYKHKSFMSDMLINDALFKHSPYEIRLRHLQMLQQQAAALAAAGGNMGPYGMSGGPYGTMGADAAMHAGPYGNLGVAGQMKLAEMYGHGSEEGSSQPDMYQRAGAAAQLGVHGTMSNNVYGTYVDTVHGTAADNVWGTMSSNVWGTIDSRGSVWGGGGGRIRNVWNTGSGVPVAFLKPVVGFIRALLGFGGGGGGTRGSSVSSSRAAFGPTSGGRR